MKTKESKEETSVLADLRAIRDKISLEIMNMTYEEERAYLDKLLAAGEKEKTLHPKSVWQ